MFPRTAHGAQQKAKTRLFLRTISPNVDFLHEKQTFTFTTPHVKETQQQEHGSSPIRNVAPIFQQLPQGPWLWCVVADGDMCFSIGHGV